MSTINRILIALGILTHLFIFAVLYFNWHQRHVQDTLITLYLGGIITELVIVWRIFTKNKLDE